MAVLYKVTWPDERVLTGTLATIAGQVRAAGMTRHALILVGPALVARHSAPTARSHLYNPTHAHRFRPARTAQPDQPERRRVPTPSVVIAVTRQGAQLARRLARTLGADVRVPRPFADSADHLTYEGSVVAEIRRCWPRYSALVLVMATGIAVRAVAPLLRHKAEDPAVICLDEAGQYVIPLLGGHARNANELAHHIAAFTGGVAAITTASDVQGRPALDLVAGQMGWRLAPGSQLTAAMAALVNGEPLGLFVDPLLPERVRAHAVSCLDDPAIERVAHEEELVAKPWAACVAVTPRRLVLTDGRPQVVYHPPVLWVGVGCRRGVAVDEVVGAVEHVLDRAGLAGESVAALVTAEAKQDEPALLEAASRLGVPLCVVPHRQLRRVPADAVSPSAARQHLGLPGVAEPAALVASGGNVMVPKHRVGRCTVAVAIGEGSHEYEYRPTLVD
ncbi:MAG: cobalamin biosynthesis protein [Ardenticatenia bacterium]|nr:cobalamin biosynthesis protein [Ardenticatenia bacterium]